MMISADNAALEDGEEVFGGIRVDAALLGELVASMEHAAMGGELFEASRVFRRLLFVRRSYDERYEEQVFA